MPTKDFKPLVTLLVIVKPLAIAPFFIHYTLDFTPEQRRRTILISPFSTFMGIQSHDPADRPDTGGVGGRGDARRIGETLSGAGALTQ